MRSDIRTERGSIIVTILILMMFFTSLVLGLLVITQANLVRARGRIMLLQAQYSAESGADAAIAQLNNGNTSYAGAASEVTVLNNGNYRSTFKTTVTNGANAGKERVIIATGKVYTPASASSARYSRTIRVTAERTSTSTASSMISRNIVEVGSGVKNIVAKDAYVNGFIKMNKNTTNLIAENITVAGKNTGAGNCSIDGSGNLVKPASFSNPGQTKTVLRLAYNNCINPPGNTNSSNFDVFVNQSTISTIQSMYIPWNYVMDGSYTDAGSCTAWTGTSPISIPASSGSKATHYPDSGSNIATTCGTNGSIDLGSKTVNISENVHLRASLCAATACTPTFNNTTPDVKYVFVEGTINFEAINTPDSSGPIVFISYGSDPASKAGVCPYGGAVYIGSNGSTSTYAPNAYFLAMNGICMDKTKFSAAGHPATQPNGLPTPALGGIGGKNIYVATNPGSPWDLALDPNFPVDQIPLDLSWRQSSYERL